MIEPVPASIEVNVVHAPKTSYLTWAILLLGLTCIISGALGPYLLSPPLSFIAIVFFALSVTLALGSKLAARLEKEPRTDGVLVFCGVASGILGLLLMYGSHLATDARNRINTICRLKQIGLAMHSYHDKHGHLPPAAIRDKQGRPLLSWRVLMLPYFEERELYNEFHLDEPWDSPHNIKLLPRMPVLYTRPGRTAEEENYGTCMQAVVGPGTVFGEDVPLTFEQITKADGTGYTLLVVEARDLVPWTKPEDYLVEPGRPLAPLGRPIDDWVPGFLRENRRTSQGVFADGHVQNLPLPPNAALIRDLATWNDGKELLLP